MSGGLIVTCQSCERVLIYGQTCVCGWHPWRKPTVPSAHDAGCADFYVEYGDPEGDYCKVCGDTVPGGDS